MQFGGTPKVYGARRRRIQLQDNFVNDIDYPHSLNVYDKPPLSDISLQEFEQFAYDRVQVLHFLDSLGLSEIKGSEKYNDKFSNFLRKNYLGFLKTNDNNEDEQNISRNLEWRKRDHISHFILRLAYCRSEELRKWFLEKEVDLFRFRFLQESSKSIQTFLKLNKLEYVPISEAEKNRYKAHLSLVSYDISLAKLEGIDYYKVPFTDVLNLVASRKVFLHDGFAYVPQNDLVSIISTRFREQLSKALALTSRSLPQLEEEERLLPILRSFNKNALSNSYDISKNKGKISVKDLEELSKISYPLCMRQVHHALKEYHHLKHWSRMQYGLFLKGIGVTLEDSLKFWRQEFGKGIGVDKFDKSYAYNIRHNYGKEGKRTDYTPYSCMTIITKNPPGSSDHHGCPFKHNSVTLLKQRLAQNKVDKEEIEEILQLVKGQHFQIACKKYFEITHKVDDAGFQLSHPNIYFDKSRQLLNGETDQNGKQIRSKDDPSFVPDWSQPIKNTDIDKLTQSQNKKGVKDMDWENDADDNILNSYMDEMTDDN